MITHNNQYNLWVPEFDSNLMTKDWFEKTYKNMDKATEFARSLSPQKRFCVQAGANLGIWPIHLAKYYDKVLTFEPDPLLYECTTRNINAQESSKNRVTIRPECLGHIEATVTFNRHKNAGMGNINRGLEDKTIEKFPVKQIALDSLDLPFVDTLFLDVEGYETSALIGATALITRHKPIIQLEMLKFTNKTDKPTTVETRAYLTAIGYEKVGNFSNDEVWKYVS